METPQNNLETQSFLESFEAREIVKKTDLWHFFSSRDLILSNNDFRRKLYAFEKTGLITPIGSGLFGINHSLSHPTKKKFKPQLSEDVKKIHSILKNRFPYTPYLVWETKVIYEFMTHQPSQNRIVLDVDKSAIESVFNFLRDEYTNNLFIEPDQMTLEHYNNNSDDIILLLGLTTQSPKFKVNDIPTAKLEKILVDVFADENYFMIFHGRELVNIFTNAFSKYWINPKTFFRYAGRRQVTNPLKEFIYTKTDIDLDKYLEITL